MIEDMPVEPKPTKPSIGQIEAAAPTECRNNSPRSGF